MDDEKKLNPIEEEPISSSPSVPEPAPTEVEAKQPDLAVEDPKIQRHAVSWPAFLYPFEGYCLALPCLASHQRFRRGHHGTIQPWYGYLLEYSFLIREFGDAFILARELLGHLAFARLI